MLLYLHQHCYRASLFPQKRPSTKYVRSVSLFHHSQRFYPTLSESAESSRVSYQMSYVIPLVISTYHASIQRSFQGYCVTITIASILARMLSHQMTNLRTGTINCHNKCRSTVNRIDSSETSTDKYGQRRET